MIEEILQKKKRKHVQDLNIVPILDMLTTVIFFLLMSTTFIEYTKLTLPPAGTVTAQGENATQPINPKLILKSAGAGSYLSLFTWGGKNPGSSQAKATDATLITEIQKQAGMVSRKFPSEKTLQISLERSIRYQALISAMDGAREAFPDMVMVSYHEADAK